MLIVTFAGELELELDEIIIAVAATMGKTIGFLPDTLLWAPY